MKKVIMNKLDKWAASKTQEEFNNWVITRIFAPIFVGIVLVAMTIDNWPI